MRPDDGEIDDEIRSHLAHSTFLPCGAAHLKLPSARPSWRYHSSSPLPVVA